MWEPGIQKISYYEDYLKKFRLLDSSPLDDDEARRVLYDTLINNLGFTVYLFSGIELLPVQEIVLKSMFIRDSGLIVAGRGFSKCVKYHHANFLREKTAGLIPITSLFSDIDFSQGERWINVKPVSLWNGHKYVDVSKVLVQPRKPTLKITTRFGYTLECAGTHILRSINGQNGQCNLNWSRASELKIGNFLPISRTPLTDYVNETDAMNLDEREAYLVGLILGDGCCTTKQISITSNDESVLKFIESFPSGTRCSKQKTAAKTIRLSTQYSAYIRQKYQLGHNKSYTKTIPENILTNLNLSKFCLRGLFDTDGYSINKNGGIGIGLTSKTLIQQIKLLLLNFGIITKSQTKTTNSSFGKVYVLEAYGQDALNFYIRIGFALSRKQNRYNILTPDKFNTNYNVIPFAKEAIHSFYNEKCKGFSIRSEAKIKINPDQRHVFYDYVRNFLSWTESKQITDPKLNNLKEILETNYFYDEIVSIEEDNEDCIDFNIPNGEQYWCNGFVNHNSFLISIFSLFYPLFYPNSKTCIVSANFRSSRRILEYCDKTLGDKEKARLLRRCFTQDLKKGNDIYKFTLPNPCGSEVFALPLSSNGGEGLRGTRANAVLVDEGLLITKEIQEFVIRPFLTAKLNFQEQKDTRRMEDRLIEQGLMKEDERAVFSRNKYMVLSSASYQFEYLYEYYKNIVTNCLEERAETDEERDSGGKPTYFAIRASYESMIKNDSIMDLTQINAAKALVGENSDYFKREYKGLFTDASSSYFDVKKMHDCTVKAGELPTLQMFGDPNQEYLLSCDPSYSANTNSDYFAFAVFLLDKKEKRMTLVHTYSQAGGRLDEHYKYLVYILQNFNIVWYAIDASGLEFIHGFNEAQIAKENNIHLQIIKAEFDTDEPNEYQRQLNETRNEYNLTAKKIVYAQKFSAQNGSIRRMNEHLQNQISAMKIWFGSPISMHDGAREMYANIEPPFKIKDKMGRGLDIQEWIDDQTTWVKDTKAQCAMIEVKASANGTLQYDLPQSVRRNTSSSRIRRDNYTTLLIAAWSAKIYFDLMSMGQVKEKKQMAMPSII